MSTNDAGGSKAVVFCEVGSKGVVSIYVGGRRVWRRGPGALGRYLAVTLKLQGPKGRVREHYVLAQVRDGKVYRVRTINPSTGALAKLHHQLERFYEIRTEINLGLREGDDKVLYDHIKPGQRNYSTVFKVKGGVVKVDFAVFGRHWGEARYQVKSITANHKILFSCIPPQGSAASFFLLDLGAKGSGVKRELNCLVETRGNGKHECVVSVRLTRFDGLHQLPEEDHEKYVALAAEQLGLMQHEPNVSATKAAVVAKPIQETTSVELATMVAAHADSSHSLGTVFVHAAQQVLGNQTRH